VGRFIGRYPWSPRMAAYTAVFLASTAVFMAVRFPSARLLEMVNQSLAAAPVNIAAQEARLTFPPGLKLSNVAVAEKNKPLAKILTVDSLVIRPSILAALTGGLKGSASSSLLGGTAEGEAKINTGGGKSELEISFEKLDPALGDWWSGFPWFKAEGKLGGSGKLEITGGQVMTAVGWLKMEVADGRIIFNKSLSSGGAPLSITSGELELKLSNGALTIGKGVFHGPQGDLLLAGGMGLAPDLPESRLNIVATLTMTEAAKAGLGGVAMFLPPAAPGGKHVFRIGGTLGQPLLR